MYVPAYQDGLGAARKVATTLDTHGMMQNDLALLHFEDSHLGGTVAQLIQLRMTSYLSQCKGDYYCTHVYASPDLYVAHDIYIQKYLIQV